MQRRFAALFRLLYVRQQTTHRWQQYINSEFIESVLVYRCQLCEYALCIGFKVLGQIHCTKQKKKKDKLKG